MKRHMNEVGKGWKRCYAKCYDGRNPCGTAVEVAGEWWCPYGGDGMKICNYKFTCGNIKPQKEEKRGKN